MRYLIDTFLKPGATASQPIPGGWVRPGEFDRFTFDHVCNGRIDAVSEDDEEGDDGIYTVIVRDNVVIPGR